MTAMAVQAQHPRISAEELLAQDHLIGSEVVDGVVHVEPRRSGTSGSAGTPTSPCGCGPPHQGRAAGPAGAATGSGPRQRRRARRLLGGAPTEGSRHDGPPDPAVDARSPTTWLPDIGRKRDVHRASDVGERRLVDAPAGTVLVYRTGGSLDDAVEVGPGDTLTSGLRPGFALPSAELFA
ncbi:PDDEXK family nuclease [Pseudonocardia thermophila]|uniref:hypothetical protein n=1 Tax=Pseudonocardia thermophila TaxID=1848 RepID=UPI001160F3A8|nr:hypothetical protein [Pseudonocardia thermophila]